MSRESYWIVCRWRLLTGGYLAAAMLSAFLLSPVATAETKGELKPSHASSGKSPANQLSAVEAKAKAALLVKEALYYEIYGAAPERDRLLAEALALAPNYPAAMWQSGYVLENNKWSKVDDVLSQSNANPALSQYYVKRNEIADNTAGHLALARWCEKYDLENQAAAHYWKVLEQEPKNVEALNRLGLHCINGQLISNAEIEAHETEAKQLRKITSNWLPKIRKIRTGLASTSENARALAKKELARIDDPAITPALERALSLINEQCALELVEKLGEWKQPRVTRALAMQSILSPWDEVRKQAAIKLQGRPYEEYVPGMLAAMRIQGDKPMSLVYTENGWLVYRDVFTQETQYSVQEVHIDNAFARVRGPRGDRYFDSASGQAEIRQKMQPKYTQSRIDTQILESQQLIQSIQDERLNDCVMASLTEATGQKLFTEPRDWWNWWNTENEKDANADKPTTAHLVRKQVLLDFVGMRDLERPQLGEAVSAVYDTPYEYDPPPLPPVPFRSSCFAAGTPVWTLNGLRAIDELKLGDVVLAQNAESGEVAMKPVLDTTIRSAVETFTIETTGGSLRCTGGHLFWVAGEGWTKARHLQNGQSLHCAKGIVQVSDVKPADPAPTYNLVVADFNTYFVGPEKILTHDVTDRKPSRALVPGLPRD